MNVPGGPDALLRSLLAAGTPLGVGLAMAASVHGADAVKPCFDAFIQGGLPGGCVLPVLDAVAVEFPEAADAWFFEILEKRYLREWSEVVTGLHVPDRAWITRLPEGLEVDGDIWMSRCTGLVSMPDRLRLGDTLNLTGCASLANLPSDLHVGGWLHLDGCAAIKTLPASLYVGGILTIRRCPAWDGIIPASARIGGHIHTDRHPDGIFLGDYWSERWASRT